jgi:hypothetical protein
VVTPTFYQDNGLGDPDESELAVLGTTVLAAWDIDNGPTPTGAYFNFIPTDDQAPMGFADVSDDPAIAPSSESFGVAFVAAGQVHFMELYSAAESSSPLVLGSPEHGSQVDEPALAWGDGAWGFVWQQGEVTQDDVIADPATGLVGDERIYFATKDGSGPSAPMAVTEGTTGGSAVDAKIAWSVDRWGVVWTDPRNGRSDVYFRAICP